MPIAPEYLHLIHQGPFPCYLYGRNSRDPLKKGRSVGDQLHEGRGLADRFGWPVVHEFKDAGLSATRHAKKTRDDFEEMIEGILERRVRLVIAYEASRYYRDLEVYVRLRKACHEAGVLLCYNGQIYDLSKSEDRRVTAQDALQAESEGEAIRDRNLRTARLTAERGGPHGPLPDGYKRRYDPETGELVGQYIDPARVDIIVGIWEHVAAGLSIGSKRKELRSKGILTHHGKEFEDAHIRYILRNPAYIGHRRYRSEDIGAAAWDGMISEETFNTVQAILDQPGRTFSDDRTPRYLLSGIGLCGEHGGDSVLTPHMNREIRSMQCHDRKDTSIKTATLEAFVEEAVITYLSSEKASAALLPQEDNEEQKVALLRLTALNTQLEESRAAAARVGPNGTMELSVASLSAIEASLLPQIKQAEEAARPSHLAGFLLDLAGNPQAEEIWEGLHITQKRYVLRKIVTVRLFKARARGVRRLEPGRITLSFIGEDGFRAERRGRGRPPAAPRAAE
ncbi:recombinase family protein [Streptomyces sp. NPDC059928]|uniref:recombinase family protein n=1 Tax=unclassified Streptomyces TaxID=2593676 RepID=UPI00364F6EBA